MGFGFSSRSPEKTNPDAGFIILPLPEAVHRGQVAFCTALQLIPSNAIAYGLIVRWAKSNNFVGQNHVGKTPDQPEPPQKHPHNP